MSSTTPDAPAKLPLTSPEPANQLCLPLVHALAQYVAAESAAIDGEWEDFGEAHQVLRGAVGHLRESSQRVIAGIDESSASIDKFLRELSSRTEEVDATLSVLESVAAGLEQYSKTLAVAFPPA
jgi:hypothetical protein